jgi:acyl-CoA synthetase (AMP-forming)/AMP-acid ligase II
MYDDTGRAKAPATNSPPLAEGEICVRGENVFHGYVSNGELGLPVHDGWLHSGDLGRRNGDGSITFVGLVKPMFARNGFNIYPREIERVVTEMPGVERAFVRGFRLRRIMASRTSRWRSLGVLAKTTSSAGVPSD